jgi:hypothetical protein
MGIPGCPEFAFWIASTAKNLIVFIETWSMLLFGIFAPDYFKD